MMSSKDKKNLVFRSSEWFAPEGKYGFVPRSWMKGQGFGPEILDGRPIIGICNTWSELTPCNRNLRELAEHVKRGILLAGGFPLEFPVMSLGEPLMRPTTMLFRNLVSMDVEESIRANPLDGVVLLASCDKTTPSLLMGAASCDIPTILVSGGPMLNGRFQGKALGSGTDIFRLDEEYRAGTLTKKDFEGAEAGMTRSVGSCNTMGTASTMATISEAMGIALPMNGSIPAPDSRRAVLAEESGKRIVDLVKSGTRISKIITRKAIENAVIVNGAVGGSTNAVVHLLALAGRLGVPFALDDWDKLGRDIPCLLDLKPSGRFLMEEFYYAGGLPALMSRIPDRLHLDNPTVEGTLLGNRLEDAPCYSDEVIRTLDNPLTPTSGMVVLRGNLCPDGAVLKPSAATPHLMQHRGKALVFEDEDDLQARIDDPDLDVDANSILVMKNSGPIGYPGMPENGTMAIPAKLIRLGVTDMIRISDGRMSGTAYGTVVLHVAPESAIGGPLAFVQTGDYICLDVANRSLNHEISDAEMATRKANWVPPQAAYDRGYGKLFLDTVLQADQGVDFDFLVGCSGTPKSKLSF